MVLGTGVRERQLPPPVGAGQRSRQQQDPQPEQVVQGVVVNPPRESRVSVRVEIVSDGPDAQQGEAAAAATWADQEYEPPAATANEALLASLTADLPPPTAARLGAPDARRAAEAYSAHAEWHPLTPRPQARLNVRA